MTTKIGRDKRRRMTADQLSQALDTLGLTAEAFAWLTGADPRRTQRWLSGEDQDIPPYVPLVTGLLTLNGAPELATGIARAFTQQEQ